MENMKKLVYCLAFNSIFLGGCVKTYEGRGYSGPETNYQLVEYPSEKTGPPSSNQPSSNDPFEQKLQKHNYVLHKKIGENPRLFLIADVHTTILLKRHNALLKDLLAKKDLLLPEGYLTGNGHPDLEEKIFYELEINKAGRKYFREVAKNNINKQDDYDDSFFKQKFPCKIESSECDVLYVLNLWANDGLRDVGSQNPETLSKDDKECLVVLEDVYLRSLHYRNLAMTRTIKKKLDENPDAKIYQVIGGQHIITTEELNKMGGYRRKELDSTSGELSSLLEKEKIPHAVVCPSNLPEELIRAYKDPSIIIGR